MKRLLLKMCFIISLQSQILKVPMFQVEDGMLSGAISRLIGVSKSEARSAAGVTGGGNYHLKRSDQRSGRGAQTVYVQNFSGLLHEPITEVNTYTLLILHVRSSNQYSRFEAAQTRSGGNELICHHRNKRRT